MIIDYILFRLVFIIFLIISIYLYKNKKSHIYVALPIFLFSSFMLINLFIFQPSLNSNLKVLNKLKNIDIEELNNIDIYTDSNHYNVSKKSDLTKIIKCFNNLEKYYEGHPRPLYEYNLILNFKNREKIKLKSIKIENKTSMMVLLNKDYEIYMYNNNMLLLYIENFIKKGDKGLD